MDLYEVGRFAGQHRISPSRRLGGRQLHPGTTGIDDGSLCGRKIPGRRAARVVHRGVDRIPKGQGMQTTRRFYAATAEELRAVVLAISQCPPC